MSILNCVTSHAILCFYAILVSFFVASAAVSQTKLTAEEVISKHLESLGNQTLRDPARSRTAKGSSLMALKSGGSGQASGPAIVSSKNGSIAIDAIFESPDYPFEQIVFDGKDLSVKQFRPGARSPIGEFFIAFDEIFREGLVGGTLSSAWAPLHIAAKRPKLKLEGTEKIDGRGVYKIRYSPRKGTDLKINLYFDAENFSHVRTEYERSVAAQSARIGPTSAQSSAQQETRFRVVENYSDFVNAAGLTLPKTYVVEYSIFSRNPILIEWSFSFAEFAFNQPFEIEHLNESKR